MLRKIDFKKMTKPPANYVPGLSRGDVGFITNLDLHNKNEKDLLLLQQKIDQQKERMNMASKLREIDTQEKNFDSWLGLKGFQLQDEDITLDERLHEKELTQIEEKIAQKKTNKRFNDSIPMDKGAFQKEKKSLASLTFEQWNQLPEAEPQRKKKEKNKYIPNQDSNIFQK